MIWKQYGDDRFNDLIYLFVKFECQIDYDSKASKTEGRVRGADLFSWSRRDFWAVQDLMSWLQNMNTKNSGPFSQNSTTTINRARSK